MDLLKKIFPLSWKYAEDQHSFIVGIIAYLIAGFVFGLIAGLANTILGWIPLIGKLLSLALGLVGGVIGAYALVGLILLILVYFKKI